MWARRCALPILADEEGRRRVGSRYSFPCWSRCSARRSFPDASSKDRYRNTWCSMRQHRTGPFAVSKASPRGCGGPCVRRSSSWRRAASSFGSRLKVCSPRQAPHRCCVKGGRMPSTLRSSASRSCSRCRQRGPISWGAGIWATEVADLICEISLEDTEIACARAKVMLRLHLMPRLLTSLTDEFMKYAANQAVHTLTGRATSCRENASKNAATLIGLRAMPQITVLGPSCRLGGNLAENSREDRRSQLMETMQPTHMGPRALGQDRAGVPKALRDRAEKAFRGRGLIASDARSVARVGEALAGFAWCGASQVDSRAARAAGGCATERRRTVARCSHDEGAGFAMLGRSSRANTSRPARPPQHQRYSTHRAALSNLVAICA